jgi:glycosyl transferase family 25
MFEFVDKVVYINLDYRTDRRSQIESELFKFFPPEKAIRFTGIDRRIGLQGCAMSHIACLKMARDNNWKNVLIVEDDAAWYRFDDGYPVLERLANSIFDVIALGTTATRADTNTFKLRSSLTTTAYLVANHYYSTLISHIEESLLRAEETNDYNEYSLDNHNKILQARDNWYRVIPALMIQRPGFSDIRQQYEDYSRNFDEVLP